MQRWALWTAGFVGLFLFNVVVESAVLPAMGLDNTPKNDVYFQAWWIVVALWLVCGHSVISTISSPSTRETSSAI